MASSSESKGSTNRGKKLRGTFGYSQKSKLLTLDNRTFSSTSSSDFRQALDLFDEKDEGGLSDDENESSCILSSPGFKREEKKGCPSSSSNSKLQLQLLAIDPAEAERLLHTRNFTNLIQGKSGNPSQGESEREKKKIANNNNQNHVHYCDEEEVSVGLPSDIPSGLVDIEGNIIGDIDVRFGQDDDDLSSLDDHTYYSRGPRHSCNSSKSSRSNKHNSHIPYGHRQHENDRSNSTKHFMNNQDSANNFTRTNPFHQQHNPPTSNNNHRQKNEDEELSFSDPGPINSISNGKVLSGNPFQNINNNSHHHDNRAIPNDFSRRNNNRNYARFPRSLHAHAPVDRNNSTSAASNNSNTITVHYYPEGGWGYVVLVMAFFCHSLLCGVHLSTGVLMWGVLDKFGSELRLESGWLGAVSIGISLLLSPIWVSICKRKSTRLAAVFGGLVASLGCLFTSFASQFHQLFLSYGVFMGVGVGLTRDASSLMVGQYFKRKRELVEIVVVSGSGLGILLMSISIQTAISSFGWRLGLQAVTGSLFLTFFLGTCYRSASLYHPQRRAILHLKNQKRKVKEKEKRDDKPPFVDYSCLRSKTLQILLLSSAFTACGVYTPLFFLAMECADEGFDDYSLVLLHVYVGAAWIIGCCLFGLIVIQKNQDCRVSKQYLCQVASVICGISMVALTSVKGFSGMVIFAWVYGFSLGGYSYALKVYTYERVRARHFPRAWSFLQCSQAIPLFLGVPLTGYVNVHVGWKSGYYMSALAVFIGSACLFLTDVRRRRLSRRKSANSSLKTCETTDGSQSPKTKRLSFAFPVEQNSPQSKHNSDEEDDQGGAVDPSVMIKELTCISEEGIADMDFQDIYFDEWAEYLGECITSCNKVENCLVSEYDPDYAVIVERRARRWSAARQSLANTAHCSGNSGNQSSSTSNQLAVGSYAISLNPKQLLANFDNRSQCGPSKDGPSARSHPKGSRVVPPRSITPIDEDSV